MGADLKTLIVPVSGGKDSQVVLSLALQEAKATGQPLVCVHQNTGFDHPSTYKHMEAMMKFYGVEILQTQNRFGGMLPFIKEAGYFPNSAARGCTKELKQKPFLAWLQERNCNSTNCEIWFGMRTEESAARNAKYGGKTASEELTLADVSDFYASNAALRLSIGSIRVFLPVVDWKTKEIFDHLKEEGAPINPLYSAGASRVGCYPCLLSRKSEWAAAAKDPVGRANIEALIAQEDEWALKGNHRKLIKIHKVWDVRQFLTDPDSLPDLSQAQCGWCSI